MTKPRPPETKLAMQATEQTAEKAQSKTITGSFAVTWVCDCGCRSGTSEERALIEFMRGTSSFRVQCSQCKILLDVTQPKREAPPLIVAPNRQTRRKMQSIAGGR